MRNNSELNTNHHINKQLIITTVSIIITVVLVMSTSFAAFVWSDESEYNQQIASGQIGVSITNTDGSLTLDSAYPANTLDVINSDDKYTFTVSNTTSNPVYYKVELVSDTDAIIADGCENNQMPLEYIKWYIGEDNSNMVNRLSENNEIVSEGYLEGSATKTIDLKIWISNDAPNSVIGSHFHGKLVLNYTQATSYTKLSDKILEDNVLQEVTPDFSKVAVSQSVYDSLPLENATTEYPTQSDAIVENGLFKSTDNDGDTYYFRGDKDIVNNYLSFAGYIWKIIRINGDGSIRIIKQENVGKSVFNSNEIKVLEIQYAGYTYDNSSANIQDGTNSTVKTYLESWYKENLINYDDYIKNTTFCNDTTSTYDESSKRTYFSPDTRITNNAPVFTCPDTDKTYGGKYNTKIGLITVDEIVSAGGQVSMHNSNYCLDSDNMTLMISPGSTYKTYNYMYNSNVGAIYSIYSNKEANIRPVINLKAQTLYTRGDGTINNPYVVEVSE